MQQVQLYSLNNFGMNTNEINLNSNAVITNNMNMPNFKTSRFDFDFLCNVTHFHGLSQIKNCDFFITILNCIFSRKMNQPSHIYLDFGKNSNINRILDTINNFFCMKRQNLTKDETK